MSLSIGNFDRYFAPSKVRIVPCERFERVSLVKGDYQRAVNLEMKR